jgi:hypothetical protein
VTDSSTPPGVEVQVSDSASLLKDAIHDEHGKSLGFSVSSYSNSNSNLSDKVFKTPATVIRARRFGDCTHCFGTDHNRFNCKFAIRCAGYFKLGHKFRYCKLKSRPIYRWRPKTISLNTEPTQEEKKTPTNSISPPMGPWLQQEGVLVDENELAHVNHLADQVVANVVMQHPDHPQDSLSISSKTSEFFRAQGPPSLWSCHCLTQQERPQLTQP